MFPKSFENGVLPHDVEATFTDIRNSLLIKGPEPQILTWEEGWRTTLLDNLEILVRQLWAAGIDVIYVDGSFVTAKDHPLDIDGFFICDLDEWQSGRLSERLNAKAPKQVWTWDQESRAMVAGFDTPKLPMWRSYRVELYPSSLEWANGIVTKTGDFVPFPDAFRLQRDSAVKKGIVKLVKE